jgi:hypothetical protein
MNFELYDNDGYANVRSQLKTAAGKQSIEYQCLLHVVNEWRKPFM